MSPSDCVYKILSADDWARACAVGVFHGAAIDLTDGYIHFSAASQVRGTLAKWFVGRSGLLLLAVQPDALPAPLRWEPARGGELFPHLYTTMPIEAVTQVWPIHVAADGTVDLPAELAR